ncbi:MAG TPA: PRC-barrel domain-containing protein [Stellaceae bacterium]|nr:PRC-barrel domain-containing protein [Stellaceae bacterium]
MRRSTLLAAASALALLAAPALAQTSSPSTSTRTLGGPSATTHQAPKVNPLHQEDVSQIVGTAVYGSDGKKVGRIDTVLMKPNSKTIDRLVVGAGGVLGIGAHNVALPVSDFHWDTQKGGFTIGKTEAELKSMQAWAGSSSGMSGSSVPPANADRASAGSSATPATGTASH